MSNVCECREKIEFKLIDGQPTFKDILQELNKLRLENECLKADIQDLRISNQLLINDNNELHNMIENQTDKKEFINNNSSDEYINFLNNDETMDCYSEAYANVSLR